MKESKIKLIKHRKTAKKNVFPCIFQCWALFSAGNIIHANITGHVTWRCGRVICRLLVGGVAQAHFLKKSNWSVTDEQKLNGFSRIDQLIL